MPRDARAIPRRWHTLGRTGYVQANPQGNWGKGIPAVIRKEFTKKLIGKQLNWRSTRELAAYRRKSATPHRQSRFAEGGSRDKKSKSKLAVPLFLIPAMVIMMLKRNLLGERGR